MSCIAFKDHNSWPMESVLSVEFFSGDKNVANTGVNMRPQQKRHRPWIFLISSLYISVFRDTILCESRMLQVMAILKGGNKERTQEPTAANKTSSRSHAVLIVSVKQRQRLAGIHQQVRVGKLFLIDLAGSERAANTQNRGKRMVEGAHINRSLLALGNCINALSE